MSGFIDRLAARVQPDRSTVRARPDALLLTHLRPTNYAAAEPAVEDDEYSAGPPPGPQRGTTPSAPPAIATAHQILGERSAAPVPPAPAVETHTAAPRSGPAPTPPAVAGQPGSQPLSTPAPTPIRPGPTKGAPEPRPTTQRLRPTDIPAEHREQRPLTTRPTSDPANQPPTQHAPPTMPAPVAILASARESRHRFNPEQPRNDAKDVPPVEITIDRIDVRLQNATPPQRPARTGPREPLSLQRYLESRAPSANGRAP